ncbi:septum formation family protein [Umezawaea beigongshangensis]|uniref:septum formation family protein n=1 Tax=Umezawaea beigongshangensis TaxID=2780383 RepID=UPI0027DAEAA5|nr:septum formation family protein [Umezawaea beigongshangensis]
MIGVRRALAAVITPLALVACTDRISGSPDVGPTTSPASTTTGPPATRVLATQLPKQGQCLDTTSFTPIGCEQRHDAEVVQVGELTGLSDAPPAEHDLRRAVLPVCRAAVNDYLGSADTDATRLQVRAFWPNSEGWEQGDRWRVCTVVELTPAEEPVWRTGSLRGVLAASGFGTFQLCAAGSPSAQEELALVSCDEPHLAETVPGVLRLGEPGDPVPSQEQVDAAAREHCTAAVTGYLGTTSRTDVFPAWRTFGTRGWSEGFTSATCYAEATRPHSGRLWGIGGNPLPG